CWAKTGLKSTLEKHLVKSSPLCILCNYTNQEQFFYFYVLLLAILPWLSEKFCFSIKSVPSEAIETVISYLILKILLLYVIVHAHQPYKSYFSLDNELDNELKWYWTEPQQGNFNYKDGNDFLVEDCSDTLSSPFEHILDLQERDASVGGIGIQGHIDTPVGPIVCSALDKLGILGLPIWFNEVDVSSDNEYVRADDLEVIFREAYAHPAVEGIMLRGMWEMFMCRPNAHLVNAEGDINEAGKRYLALKQEWLSHSHGHIDEQGQFCFSGFHGSYEVEVITGSKKITKNFVVDKGGDALVISIDM
ncbi:endo-1,4-beta-xylanase 1-like, partial [Nicotiana tomentosiformis]|uniref:endo-1,4-beta-xylanase 1-like n=1 Tax=Nicotiana tomentosiformis TaxID=4098 RepID=UPI00388C3BAD